MPPSSRTQREGPVGTSHTHSLSHTFLLEEKLHLDQNLECRKPIVNSYKSISKKNISKRKSEKGKWEGLVNDNIVK